MQKSRYDIQANLECTHNDRSMQGGGLLQLQLWLDKKNVRPLPKRFLSKGGIYGLARGYISSGHLLCQMYCWNHSLLDVSISLKIQPAVGLAVAQMYKEQEHHSPG